MIIENDYSITKLFAKKEINIFIDKKVFFKLRVPVILDLYNDNKWNNIFFLWTRTPKDAQKYYYKKIETSLDMITLIVFDAAQYKEYADLSKDYTKYLKKWLPDIEFDYKHQKLKIKGLTITPDIWDHILYLLKLSCGEKVTQPPVFNSEEARKLYLAQQEQEEKIRKIKSQASRDKEGLMNGFLAITYAFPSITFDYLFNQTMAQIQWLQKKAAGAVSYEVNAQAYAAGNVKKGKKLDFFIK